MTEILYRTALIVGAGPCLSAAGVRVGLAARNIDKLAALADETGARPLEIKGSRMRRPAFPQDS